MKPGLSEDLMKLQSDINKNIKYVLGSADQKEEIRKQEYEKSEDNNNKEDHDR